MNIPHHSLLVVLSAPSGAGKSTICQKILTQNDDFKLSVSATTRPPRPNEKDGVHYFFISKEQFFKAVENGDFLEYEEVHGNYYGTMKSKLQEMLDKGYNILFDIDVNGALNIKKHYPESILIFIRPPSMKELKRRLQGRNTDNKQEIEKRLQRLPGEYEKAKFFEYDIINLKLDYTVLEIIKIIKKHQIR